MRMSQRGLLKVESSLTAGHVVNDHINVLWKEVMITSMIKSLGGSELSEHYRK